MSQNTGHAPGEASMPNAVSFAWTLTRALSPRSHVRVQSRDASGALLPTYATTSPLTGPAPANPWAMPLADEHSTYHFVCLDLDGKSAPAAAQARLDRSTLTTWLRTLGIAYVVCKSGGIGSGWHIWIALTEPAQADAVRALAAQLALCCPTLDKSPLSNPRSGCVRPPGSPHASGGHSEVVEGHLGTLLRPTTTPDSLELLAALAADAVDALPQLAAADQDVLSRLPRDDQGEPYLSGPRRALPPASAAALATAPSPSDDASGVLMSVLLGMARARWHWADVLGALHHPGMEHARTTRGAAGTRIPRPRAGAQCPQAVLARQWRRALAYVATRPDRAGDDPTYATRTHALAAHVEALQERADASPGRWSRRAHALARRVLDFLCLTALTAVTAAVDADIRRIALATGTNRDAAWRALQHLADEGWITRTHQGSGTQADTWTIDPQDVIPNHLPDSLTQAAPPRGASPLHSAWRARLHARQTLSAHDAFTSRGLGPELGNHLANPRLPTEPGIDIYGLAQETNPTRLGHKLDQLARQLDVAGTGARRRAQYALERVLYRWWLAHLARRRHEPAPTQAPLVLAHRGQWRPHPTRANGRADYRKARTVLTSLWRGAPPGVSVETLQAAS